MALPRKLKDFNLFVDGESWQGLIPSITLPELARTFEDYRGGGMDGAVGVDVGQEPLNLEFSAGGLIESMYAGFGSGQLNGVLLRFEGSYESDETGEVVGCTITCRGRYQTLSHDEFSPGSADNNTTVTARLSYYRLTVNGRDLIEIDLPGMIFRVSGEDRLAARRRALGL